MPATEVVGLLRANKISTHELLDDLESRIQYIDPLINALPILCFDRAREFANSLYKKNPDERGILAGLPVPIKDLCEVSGVKTTFGSRIYADNISSSSDLLVDHLENQGAVIYAKSNTPEFGTGGNTRNDVFGKTRNPWNQEMSVAGSSGGAAAALACGTAWIAQGSDMGGSLRNPASFCGIVGLRPSIGRVATTRSSCISDTLSTNGPMARNVTDLALMFDAMCGYEPMDPLSMKRPKKSFLDSARRPKLPKSIAYSYNLGITPVDPKTRTVFTQTIEKIQNAGVIIEERHPNFSGLHETFHTLRASDYASGLADLLPKYEALMDPNVVWNIKQGLKLSVSDIAKAETSRVDIIMRVQKFFHENQFLITPATVVPPYPVIQDHVSECDGVKFDNYYQWLSIAYAFTTALCPAMAMPCGFTDDNLPVGLQIASKACNEGEILSLASALEEIFETSGITPINPIT